MMLQREEPISNQIGNYKSKPSFRVILSTALDRRLFRSYYLARTAPFTGLPVRAALVAKLMSARASHVRTPLISLNHCLASLALCPTLVIRQVQQLFAVLVRRAHSLMFRILAQVARDETTAGTCRHGAFQILGRNERRAARFRAVYRIRRGALGDLGFVVGDKLRS